MWRLLTLHQPYGALPHTCLKCTRAFVISSPKFAVLRNVYTLMGRTLGFVSPKRKAHKARAFPRSCTRTITYARTICFFHGDGSDGYQPPHNPLGMSRFRLNSRIHNPLGCQPGKYRVRLITESSSNGLLLGSLAVILAEIKIFVHPSGLQASPAWPLSCESWFSVLQILWSIGQAQNSAAWQSISWPTRSLPVSRMSDPQLPQTLANAASQLSRS